MRQVYIGLVILACVSTALGQEVTQRKVIQFTGVIFGSDSISVVPGAHIYIPANGRGTSTNAYGFFSMPVLEGDSIIFSAVGFKRMAYIVPPHDKESSLRVVLSLKEDITFLEEVEIRPYPTEAMFKEAVITMELPHQKEYANIYSWLNSEYMALGYQSLAASPNANSRYLINQQQQAYVNRYAPPVNNFLNPFAWASFIKSLRKKKK